MTRILRRATARQDLIAIFRYYAENAGLAVARRFRAQAEATVERLAAMPGLGALYQPEVPLWADVRYFPVSRFKNYVIFYRAFPGGIELLHVLHGARDIHGIFDDEFGADDEYGPHL